MRSWDGLSQDSIVLTYCHLPETCDLWNQEESGKTLITSVAKKKMVTARDTQFHSRQIWVGEVFVHDFGMFVTVCGLQ